MDDARLTTAAPDARWNDTARPFPTNRCIQDLVDEAAARTPDATAVICGADRVTYAQLMGHVDRVARTMRRYGVTTDTPVAICAERSVEMVVGLLAILRAGGAYVPLDPDHPADRLGYILDDSGARLVLSQPHLTHRFATDRQIVLLDLDLDLDGPVPPAPLAGGPGDPLSLAYILYTSGTTGRPKGVAVPHLGVVNRLVWMRDEYAVDADDVVLQKTPFGFDVSVWELFLPLMCGARLVMARPDGHGDPEYLAKLIAEHAVTTVHFVPTMLAHFLAGRAAHDMGAVRRVICSGEALTPELLAEADRVFPGRVHNLYGPTEASIDVSAHHCTAGSGSSVPIGRPIANTRLHVLTADGRPAGVGAVGELHIGGVGLARGYHRRPGLTAERFVPDPFGPGRLYRTGDLASWSADGMLLYHGRTDHQVKIAGHRVELGEIEHALTALPEVRHAVVVTVERDGRTVLAAYVVREPGTEFDADTARTRLAQRLPHYMIPDVWGVLDRLPTTTTGKLDRKGLPPLDTAPVTVRETPADPARKVLETLVTDVWAEALGTDSLDRHEDVFTAGANSMLALRVLSRLRHAFAIRIRLIDLFEHRSVASLAVRIAEIIEAEDAASDHEPVAGRPA